MASIKKEITSGVFWIALAKYSGLFISLGITAVLSRNVTPTAFGTMAVATVILAFLDIFADIGIGVAVIQFKDLTKKQLNTLFMLGCGIGLVLALILFFGANSLAHFYSDPTLIPICQLLCICLIFKALNIVPNGMMLKNKRFKAVSLRTFTLQVMSGAIAIWGALHGWEIYALVVSPVLSSIGVFFFNFYNYPQQFTLNLDWSAIKRVWSYSSFQFLFSFTNYFSRNLDKLIIGKYFSMADLGYYDKSYRLMQMPLQNITFVISPVLHPILSSLQDNKAELGKKNIKLATILSYLSFPIGLLLYFGASEIINIIFGPGWEPAIPVFKILALSIPLQMILSTCGPVFLAAGKSNHLFYTGIINTTLTVVGFMLAALYFRTIESMAWAWDITLLLGFVNSYFCMYKYTFKTSFLEYLRSFLPQILNSAIVGGICFILFDFIPIHNNILNLAFKVIVIFILTVTFAFILHQYNIIQILRKFVKRKALK